METLNEGVVEQEHDGREVPSPLGAPEEHLANVTNISSLGMSQTEFPSLKSVLSRPTSDLIVHLPNNERSVKHECGLNHGQDETGHETQDRVRVRERHDGQTDIL